MPGERTPEQGNGDSTPVYGSFEEESFELEEAWEQQQSPVKEERVEQESMSTETECVQEPVANPEDFTVAESPRSQVQEMCIPETNQATTIPFPVSETEEQTKSTQSSHDTELAATVDEEEGSDLETEESDQQLSVRRDPEGEESVGQDLSLDSDSAPGSPEPLDLVEELQEEEELNWDEGNDGEIVLHCRKIRKLLVEEKTGGGSEGEAVDELGEKEAFNSENPGNVKKFVVVDSCTFLSRLPLVKELLQESRCTPYVCYQVVFPVLVNLLGVTYLLLHCKLQVLKELRFRGEGEFSVRMRAVLRWIANSGHLGMAFQSQSEQLKVAAKVTGQQDKSGEALILETCLALKRKCPTILLTEDHLLGKKARASGILVASSAEVKEKLDREQDDCCPRSDQVLFPIEVVLKNISWPCHYFHSDVSAE